VLHVRPKDFSKGTKRLLGDCAANNPLSRAAWLGVFSTEGCMYRCEAKSVEGFVQQLAVCYVGRGYWFYVAGCIPKGKDPHAVDQKLIDRYQIGISKWAKARRKQAGFANLQYIRFERFFIILATHGNHRFFEEEAAAIRDVRRCPIRFAGYSISFRGNHVQVRIEKNEYRMQKAYLLDLAVRRSPAALEDEFRRIPFEPYAPIRSQVLSIFRAVNGARKAAGFVEISRDGLRLKRRVVQPFDLPNTECKV